MIGYAMSEKQGGSDLRETQTTARLSPSGDYHGKTAHRWPIGPASRPVRDETYVAASFTPEGAGLRPFSRFMSSSPGAGRESPVI